MNRASGGDGAPRALFAGLVLIAAARLAGAWAPGRTAWGLDTLRHLPVWGWALWGVAALALVPALVRPLLPAVAGLGSWCAAHPRAAGALGAAGAALLVALFPDRLHFAGDFLLREHALDAPAGGASSLFPQAMPLDLPLHDGLARRVMAALPLEANDWGRLLGAVEAGVLAWLAARVPRALGLDGAAACAASMAAFWSGALLILTGYNKSFTELGLATLAVGVYGAGFARTGRGAVALGAWFAAGLMLHRVALLLAPAVAVAFAIGIARHGGAARLRRPDAWIGAALAVTALAAAAPIVLRLGAFDVAVNFDAARDAAGPGQAGGRALDLVNLAMFVAPLAALVPLIALARPRAVFAAPERIVIAALVIPLAGFLPWFHPTYGPFRNFDDAVPTGVALSLAAAALAGASLGAGRRAWLAPAVALAAAWPVAGELWLAATPASGLARIEAYVSGSPPRAEFERAAIWDFLGFRYTDLGRLDDGAAAFARAAALAPSPRTLRAWAVVETRRGNLAGARVIYRQMVARKPDEAVAWYELARIAAMLGDRAEADSAMRRFTGLAPEGARPPPAPGGR